MEPKSNKELNKRTCSSIRRYAIMLFVLLCIAYPISCTISNDKDNSESTHSFYPGTFKSNRLWYS